MSWEMWVALYAAFYCGGIVGVFAACEVLDSPTAPVKDHIISALAWPVAVLEALRQIHERRHNR